MPGSKKSLYEVSLKEVIDTKKDQAIEKIIGGANIKVSKYVGCITIHYHKPIISNTPKPKKKSYGSKTIRRRHKRRKRRERRHRKTHKKKKSATAKPEKDNQIKPDKMNDIS